MSKTLVASMTSHLAQMDGTLKLATCWKLTREDATVMGFTDHDDDITYGGVTYEASAGMTPTDIESSGGMNVDNMEVAGFLQSTKIDHDDIVAGLYDNASVEIFMIRWDESPSYSSGIIKLRKGYIGEITVKNGQFVAEMRGLAEALQQSIGKVYQPTCRVDFCSSECTLATGTYTSSGTVGATVTDRSDFQSNLTQADGFFSYGRVTWTSGNNNGYTMEVKKYTQTNGRVQLQMKMPYDIQTGDTFNILRGCDKKFSTCRDDYSNQDNFRGEPHIPGIDEMMKFGGQ